ncbi:MAG: hypothetical protein ACJ0GJ_00015 [Candidatus Actinomarina sp.]
MKTYLKIKRAIRYLFYKHISVEDQLKVKEQFNNDDLTRLFLAIINAGQTSLY